MLTIGAYGFEPEKFFATLKAAHVDIFIDVRQRRGMRGPRYAFANATRLQAKLAANKIEYRHIHELAPDAETRGLQKQADAAVGTTKAERLALTPAFVATYEQRNLAPFQWDELVEELARYQAPVIFCVEQTPDACHRSLVAKRIAQAIGTGIRHLAP